MGLLKLFRDSRLQVVLVLTAVWLLAVWHFRILNSFVYPILAVGIVTICDLAITYLRSRKLYLPASSFVSGFLIGLIIAPTEKIWVVAIAAIFASLSKQFIGAGIRRHIFNPAAFGIMAVNLVAGTSVVWWGVAWGKSELLILVPAMAWILWRLKRLWIPITFLAVYFVYLSFLMTPAYAFKTLVDGSFMLFALVMLPEPITSPSWGYFKYPFGVLVAVLAIIISKIAPAVEFFLAALLIGNLIGFLALRAKAFGETKTPK
ncbi:MAG: RnfABCDGE type electron transport complex subunit D [Candidatus Curtissbacteria bacterium]|nr:RnfABCDGE type electron transport complex subunit D [Candidatus Curtissbacteria bacterium]